MNVSREAVFLLSIATVCVVSSQVLHLIVYTGRIHPAFFNTWTGTCTIF